MPLLVTYLVKLSVSLAVVFLFYYFILRKLTFYNHNRWYLLGYTLLCFFIPLINISAVLKKNNWDNNSIVTWVPVLQSNGGTATVVAERSSYSTWDILLFIVVMGICIMLVRMLVQLFSFRRMMKKAVPLSAGGMQVYQVDAPIIPFSFGNSIFINSGLHSEEELKEIILHEFVHVKQRHSLDIIWAELLCLVNWFNPFAWLLKNAIRQNLEFIADNKVLEKGANKKEYQYLLLKVTGNKQYSIATKFNFSSLKKRITMMNKTKSAKRQLVRLLFLLPATAVLLLAFRNKWNNTEKNDPADKQVAVAGLVVDATTMEPLNNATIYVKEQNITVKTDANGYYLITIPVEKRPLHFTMLVSKEGYAPLHQQENWGDFSEAHIYDRYSKTIEFFGLSPDKSQNRSFSTIAGNTSDLSGLNYDKVIKKLDELRNALPSADWQYIQTDTLPDKSLTGHNSSKEFMKRNPDVSRVGWVYRDTDDALHIVITRKDGTTDEYNLEDEADVRKAETKYGKLPAAPPPPPPMPAEAPIPPVEIREVRVQGVAVPPAPPAPGELTEISIEGMPIAPEPPEPVKLPSNVEKINVVNNEVTITLKNGKQEKYDLSKPEDKKKLESKYGEVITAPQTAPVRAGGVRRTVSVRAADRSTGSREATGGSRIVTTNGEPLYVMDGEITTRAEVSGVSPSKIAAVHVLKGEGATSVYGAKAKDGAVVITTKATGENYTVTPAVSITADEDILVTITADTNPDQLEAFKKQMKEKGIVLTYDDIKYDKGKLVRIAGSLKSSDGHSNFTASDFSTLILSLVKKDYRNYFKVSIANNN